MKRKRIEYGLLALFVLFLLFSFSERYLLSLILLLMALIAVAYIFTSIMLKDLSVQASVKESCVQNEDVCFRFHINGKLRIPLIRGIRLHMELSNPFMNEGTKQEVLLEFGYGCRDYDWIRKAESVGSMKLHVTKVEIVDLFELVSREISPCNDASTVVYPKLIATEIAFSDHSLGFSENEGIAENAHGNDRNEVLNYREYVPGDDIRNIHWKLSAKTDEIFVRETANTHHYDVLLMADIGFMKGERKAEREEINMVVTCFYSLAEKLSEYKIPFCLGFCTERGIDIREIRSRSDLDNVSSECLQYTLLETYGKGISYFDMNHYENIFSKLIYISNGPVLNLNLVNGKMTGVIIDVDQSYEKMMAVSSGSFQFMQIPSHLKEDAQVKIIC